MPQLNFSIEPAGLVVSAVVGLNDQDMVNLVNARQPIPRPVQARALIDTGTDTTMMAPRIFQQLGLASVLSAISQSTSGLISINLFRVSLSIFGSQGSAGPMLVRPDLMVGELTSTLSNDLEVLIGQDLLLECLLVLDGPERRFILAF